MGITISYDPTYGKDYVVATSEQKKVADFLEELGFKCTESEFDHRSGLDEIGYAIFESDKTNIVFEFESVSYEEPDELHRCEEHLSYHLKHQYPNDDQIICNFLNNPNLEEVFSKIRKIISK